MLAAERRKAILKLIEDAGAVQVPDLSSRFDTSASTIRRDLELLASRGKLRRTHGGAIASGGLAREFEQVDDLARRIGQEAAHSFGPDETVFLGSGPLCHATAWFLSDRSDLTIITNGLAVAWRLYQESNLSVILTGGPVVRPGGAMVGQIARQTLDTLRADRLVMEVSGVGPIEGLTIDQLTQAEVLRPLMASVGQITVLATAERLGRAGAAWLGPVSEADVIITGREAPTAIVWDLSEIGVKVTLV